MKRLKNLVFFILLIFILLGIYSSISQSPKQSTKQITYHKLETIINEQKKETFTIYEKENGTLLIQGKKQSYLTQVNPTDNNVKDLLKKHNIKYKYVKDTSFLDFVFKFIVPILLLLIIFNFLTNRNQGMNKGNDMIKKTSKKAEIPTLRMEDVGGLTEETRQEINQIIEIFKNKEEAQALGIRPAKGALLHGPPGTGKTILAKAIASELGASFYATSGSNFVEMFVGVGASRVRELFEDARRNKPALIFIDEIDSVAKKRGMGHSNDERESTLNELLKQLDGVESNEDVFLIAATNRIDTLDEAILRPGRFDYKILIGLPDLEGRKEIIRIHSKNKKLSKEVVAKLDEIADSTIEFSGAQIESIFNVAAKKALREKRKEISLNDINHALDVTILGNQTRQLTNEETKKRVAYHEAGHALVSVVNDPKGVRKATIIPRGEALGYVAPLPKEMNLSTRSQLIKRIAVILAGGVAEIKKFGEHSIGVSGDVEQAKNIIEYMVDKVGMKGNDFVLTFTEKEKHQEMDAIYHESLELCKNIIEQYEKEFEELTEKLTEKETLTGEEIERIVYHLPEPVEETEAVEEPVAHVEEQSSTEQPIQPSTRLQQGTT